MIQKCMLYFCPYMCYNEHTHNNVKTYFKVPVQSIPVIGSPVISDTLSDTHVVSKSIVSLIAGLEHRLEWWNGLWK